MSLDSLLARAFPYPNREHVKTEVQNVCRMYPSLTPDVGELVREDGSDARLLLLDGTIPMFYASAQYNVPVNIWIPENFPLQPPVVYVTPTPSMYIVDKHRHVDTEGRVYHMYLTEFSRTSTLHKLVQQLSTAFSSDPPIYSKPPAASAAAAAGASSSVARPPDPGRPPQPYGQPPLPFGARPVHPPGVALGASGGGGGVGGMHQHVLPPMIPAQHPPQPPVVRQPPPPVRSSEADTRDTVIPQITAKLKEFSEHFLEHISAQVDELVQDETLLSQRADYFVEAKSHLARTKQHLEQCLAAYSAECDNLTQWLEHDATQVADKPLEEVLVMDDEYSKEVATLLAADRAMDEALYHINKAFTSGKITIEVFLKYTRLVAREQFYKRAAIRKLFQDRMRAVRPSSAASPQVGGGRPQWT